MRVFITGGRGYVGGRLTEHLVKNGYEVFVGTRRKVGQDRLFYGAQLIQTNLFDDNFLSRIDKKFDGIVHCAAMNAIECSTDPLEAIKVNGLGTAHLVRSAKKHGVKKFIHLSTTHVYSDDPEGMIDEDTPAQNLHPYASSHLAGEFQTLYGGLDGRMETIVLRLSNGVGAPIQQNIDCWSLVVNDFCRQAVTANNVCIKSRPQLKRDFVSISDVTAAIRFFLSSNVQGQGRKIYNLCSGKTMTLRQAAEIVKLSWSELSGKEKISIQECDGPSLKKGIKDFSFSNKKIVAAGFSFDVPVEREIRLALEKIQSWGLQGNKNELPIF